MADSHVAGPPAWRLLHAVAHHVDKTDLDIDDMIAAHRLCRLFLFYFIRCLPSAFHPEHIKVIVTDSDDVDLHLDKNGARWDKYVYKLHERITQKLMISELNENDPDTMLSVRKKWKHYQPAYKDVEYVSVDSIAFLHAFFDYFYEILQENLCIAPAIITYARLCAITGVKYGPTMLETTRRYDGALVSSNIETRYQALYEIESQVFRQLRLEAPYPVHVRLEKLSRQ